LGWFGFGGVLGLCVGRRERLNENADLAKRSQKEAGFRFKKKDCRFIKGMPGRGRWC